MFCRDMRLIEECPISELPEPQHTEVDDKDMDCNLTAFTVSPHGGSCEIEQHGFSIKVCAVIKLRLSQLIE